MRRRFFVEKYEGTSAVIEGDTAHHLGHVLRAQKDQLYELSDGTEAWLGRIESVGRDRVEFVLLEPLPGPQLSAEVTLLLSVVKFDAFEWAIEKATELGVGSIVPLAAARSEKGLLAAAEKRSQRWKKILLEASQQSRRLRVPVLEALAKPGHAFGAPGDSFRVMLSERADAPSLRKVLVGVKSGRATLAIGPEGGWTDEEIDSARAAGFQEASLGQLILRTETAVVAALAMVNYALTPDQS
ncbi:MAG: RsmE family RNA methyltransferase [Candidatus Acidiferrum sp.]